MALMSFETATQQRPRRKALEAEHEAADYPEHAMPAIRALGETVPILRALVATPSVNPDQVDDPATNSDCGELRMAEALYKRFQALGADEAIIDDGDTSPGRPHVMGIWRAHPTARAPRWLGIDVHMDTVAVKGMTPHPPFGAVVTVVKEEGSETKGEVKIHGRGACDTKATFANVLALLGETRDDSGAHHLQHNLVIAGSVGEETSRLGALALKAWLKKRNIVLDDLIVAEPTSCDVIFGHKGHVRLRFDVTGVPVHSSQPHLGKNAVVAAAALTTALYEEGLRLAALPQPPRDDGCDLGSPTLTPTLTVGGSGINIVPGAASVSVDRRVIAGERVAEVEQKLETFAREVMDNHDQCTHLHVSATEEAGEAFVQSSSSELVTRLLGWGGGVARVAAFGTNAGVRYDPVARSVVVFGPGSVDQAHKRDEWITLSQLLLHKSIMRKWLFEPWSTTVSRL